MLGLARADELTITAPRRELLLDSDWRTAAFPTGAAAPAGVETAAFHDSAWRIVSVPHNWDAYEGFRQLRHGDRHGTAWYRRRFRFEPVTPGADRVFLFFEGVGSYATVWVNGTLAGQHAGGLTTFTLDVTDLVRRGPDNLLVVRADHPAGIRDLPWVCGGCERAYGFSEGTQPFGIFRPVHLVTTAAVRVEPFGVQVWNNADVTPASAPIHVRTEVKNYGRTPATFSLVTQILAPDRAHVAAVASSDVTLAPGAGTIVAQEPPAITTPQLWSPASPALYQAVTRVVAAGGAVLDATTTEFGLRTIHWPAAADADGRFRVNGQPVFLNGVCDYEHNLGNSHAFTPEQVTARVAEIEAAGFNAFRDAHHPHNLRFQERWDADGLLWWTQFGAHVWFDNDAFRANFKARLRDWVKERRNSPSLVLWGLQNESVLPTDFAAECAALIRELDPTASSQRKITTCNGGTGTDWDVPQNWSGTYGDSKLSAYADDLRRQRLVGEYGAWRSLGLHTEGGFVQKGPLSEDRMAALLETKVRAADSARDAACGQFLWILTTHSNPGRNVGELGEQADDGIRPLDQISPANNKGLFTLWGEPTDAYAMYRSNFIAGPTAPMVHLVSPTWPDRWTTPGTKSGIVVYSNCDEVELFNDLGTRSLGRRTRGGPGTHFTWDDVEIATNILYAEGRVGGKVVARDLIQLHHLPEAPVFAAAARAQPDILSAAPGRNYLYRVNCGGPDYTDRDGHRWLADRAARPGDSWGSLSWADAYPNLDPRFGSVRRIYVPVSGTRDPALFQTFRYGRDELQYRFQLPNGDYDVELYFAEPWYGDRPAEAFARGALPPRTGYGIGWRVFDVAVNGTTVLRHLDLIREAGRAQAIRKTVSAQVTDGRLVLSFPRVAAGQAVISAIAISSADPNLRAPALPGDLIAKVGSPTDNSAAGTVRHALDTGDRTYADSEGGYTALPPELLEADWIETPSASTGRRYTVRADATLFLAWPGAPVPLTWGRALLPVENAAPGSPGPTALPWERTAATVHTNAAPAAAFTVCRTDVSAGATIELPAAAAPAPILFVVPRRPAPAAQVVRSDTPSTRVTGDAQPGREIYPHSHLRLTAVPANLTGGDLVAGPISHGGELAFVATDYVEVNVAIDPRVTARPSWLADWIETRDFVGTSASEAPKLRLFRHRFAPDQFVRLGRLAGPPARETLPPFAIVRAVRPSSFLEAEAAQRSGAAVSRPAAGASQGKAVLLPADGDDAITWTVTVGVGDRYGLDFRFTADAPTAATKAELTIIGADGQVVRTDTVEFPAVAQPGTWTFLRTRTGASINAGTYRLRLKLASATPLLIDSLEVE